MNVSTFSSLNIVTLKLSLHECVQFDIKKNRSVFSEYISRYINL